MPYIGAEALQHHSADRCTRIAVALNCFGNQCGRSRVARPVVADHRYVPHFHHKIGSERGQQFIVSVTQTDCHAMRAVGMDDASGVRLQQSAGRVDFGMQCDGFAGFVAADLLCVGIKFGKPLGLQISQASVGRRDQEPAALVVVQAHADVAGCGMHIAAIEQTFANATNLFAGLCFGHDDRAKALVKKSTVPKLPDLSAKCKPSRAACVLAKHHGTPGSI